MLRNCCEVSGATTDHANNTDTDTLQTTAATAAPTTNALYTGIAMRAAASLADLCGTPPSAPPSTPPRTAAIPTQGTDAAAPTAPRTALGGVKAGAATAGTMPE